MTRGIRSYSDKQRRFIRRQNRKTYDVPRRKYKNWDEQAFTFTPEDFYQKDNNGTESD